MLLALALLSSTMKTVLLHPDMDKLPVYSRRQHAEKCSSYSFSNLSLTPCIHNFMKFSSSGHVVLLCRWIFSLFTIFPHEVLNKFILYAMIPHMVLYSCGSYFSKSTMLVERWPITCYFSRFRRAARCLALCGMDVRDRMVDDTSEIPGRIGAVIR